MRFPLFICLSSLIASLSVLSASPSSLSLKDFVRIGLTDDQDCPGDSDEKSYCKILKNFRTDNCEDPLNSEEAKAICEDLQYYLNHGSCKSPLCKTMQQTMLLPVHQECDEQFKIDTEIQICQGMREAYLIDKESLEKYRTFEDLAAKGDDYRYYISYFHQYMSDKEFTVCPYHKNRYCVGCNEVSLEYTNNHQLNQLNSTIYDYLQEIIYEYHDMLNQKYKILVNSVESSAQTKYLQQWQNFLVINYYRHYAFNTMRLPKEINKLAKEVSQKPKNASDALKHQGIDYIQKRQLIDHYIDLHQKRIHILEKVVLHYQTQLDKI